MNKDRKVVMLRRDPDGKYERVDPIPSEPRPCESGESKRLRELAAYGNMACRVKDGGCWAELRCVPAGAYIVGGEQITALETYRGHEKRSLPIRFPTICTRNQIVETRNRRLPIIV